MENLQVVNVLTDGSDFALQPLMQGLTGELPTIFEGKDVFDFLKGEAEVFGVFDEAQPLDVLVGKEAIAGPAALEIGK